MSRLYGDLIQSSGKRFYFALDSAPGIISPGVSALVLNGKVPIAVEPLTVFRSPSPAALGIGGLTPGAPIVVSPSPAALGYVGQIPSRQLIRIITNALAAAIESPPTSYAPTLIPIWTTNPGVGQVRLQTLEINITEGGNIGFVSPAAAQLMLGTLPYTLLVLGAGAGLGQLQILGLAPSVTGATIVTPNLAQLLTLGNDPSLSLPFTWIDDDPALTRTWITDVAA
jgi:hypothetical protein